MNVKQLLEQLEIRSMKEICQEIGIHPSTIQRRLKRIGYAWNNSAKRWEWHHDEEQPLDLNLLDEINVKYGHRGHETDMNRRGDKSEMHAYSPRTFHALTALTAEEIQIIREMVQEWKRTRQIEPGRAAEGGSLHERVKAITREEKKRKTIVINKSVAERLDRFAKAQKVDKQDIIELALIDFMDRYE